MALLFIRVYILDDDASQDAEEYYLATRMEDVIRGFKQTLRGSKQKRVEQRLQNFSEAPMSLDEVTNVVEDESLWSGIDNIMDRAHKQER